MWEVPKIEEHVIKKDKKNKKVKFEIKKLDQPQV